MAKTFVVKLAETVDNPNLPYLGEIRIRIKPFSTIGQSYAANQYTQYLTLSATEPIPMEIIGDGHFTDSTLTQDLGKTYTMPAGKHTIYVSDGDNILSIRNKYAITLLEAGNGGHAAEGVRRHWNININDLMYMKNLTGISLFWSRLHGDLSALKASSSLTYLYIVDGANTLTGNLSDLATLTQLTNLNLTNGNQIRGNISSLLGLTELKSAKFDQVYSLTGDTSSIAALHPNNGGKLATLSKTNTGVTGTWPPSA